MAVTDAQMLFNTTQILITATQLLTSDTQLLNYTESTATQLLNCTTI